MNIFRNKSRRTIVALLFCIFILVWFCTIAYSAVESTMNVSGNAVAKIETDVRITNFSLSEVVNATTSYIEFSKDTVMSSITFDDQGYVIYEVEITNYGDSDVGILDITGVPDNVSFDIIDYELKDKLCDGTGKCNSFAISTFYLKLSGDNCSASLNLYFDFRKFYNISYNNFSGNYPTEILGGDFLEIDLSVDSPELIYINCDCIVDYSYDNNILKLSNVNCDCEINMMDKVVKEFSYTGSVQEFVVPYDGMYKIELWGSGGNLTSSIIANTVGKGAYTSGSIYLNKGMSLYFYVGGTAAFNGRGIGEASGGSATDVRLLNGTWSDFDSLKSRIMVAAGGGGGVLSGSCNGDSPGDGGGLNGYDASFDSKGHGYEYSGHGGTQIAGGEPGKESSMYTLADTAWGKFGKGGYISTRASGGGSGYYGGGHGVHPNNTWPGGGGGSSFISGHNGCDAISESSVESNIVHTGQSVHYSGYKFVDTVMIDGRGYRWTTYSSTTATGMPTFSKDATMLGNSSTGYARIELVQIAFQYDIDYVGINGDYQATISSGNDLVVDFAENAPSMVSVFLNGNKVDDFTYEDGIFTMKNVIGDIEIVAWNSLKYQYEYSGESETFVAPYSGIYKIEAWGAYGVINDYVYPETVGKGAYTAGNIVLRKNMNLYLYVGGSDLFNSGSYGEAPGGGATDIRLVSGDWNDFDSLKSRIMVAAGGGGGVYNRVSFTGDSPGDAGGLIGYDAVFSTNNQSTEYCGHGASQTSGGLPGKSSSYYQTKSIATGKFGSGGYMYSGSSSSPQYRSSGGGGGYYGGGHGVHTSNSWPGAGGGSSFISGHDGCDAIDIKSTSSSIVHTGQSVHYSGYKFDNTKMIDGRGYEWTNVKGDDVVGMPTFDGSSTMIGNTGTGYVKITLVELN